ncbi:MAG TPA: hypothetical protein VGK81_01685 [Anaerolineae bacterium]
MREQYQALHTLTGRVSIHPLHSLFPGDLCKDSNAVDAAAARITLREIQ